MYRGKQQTFFLNAYFPFFRLLMAVVCAVVLMFVDAYYHGFDTMKVRISGAITSVVSVVSWPVRYLEVLSSESFFPEERALKEEIARLQAISLNHALLERDIAQLRALLAVREANPMNLISAEVLYAYRDPLLYAVAVDKGKNDGVINGFAVINARGVLGQVVATASGSARVRLAVNPDSAIPVEVLRNHQPAVVVGLGDGRHLLLQFLQSFDDVRVGDVLVTSGLDREYPRGVPVGVVERLSHDFGHHIVSVRPYATIEDGPVVFVVCSPKGFHVDVFDPMILAAPSVPAAHANLMPLKEKSHAPA